MKRLRVDAVGLTAGYRNMSQVLVKDSMESKGFLGEVFTLSGKLNIRVFRLNQVSLLLTPGVGVAYSTSSFFIDGNPIVASRINLSPQVGIEIKTPLTQSTSLIAGANLFHYSNIALRVPNNGVNALILTVYKF